MMMGATGSSAGSRMTGGGDIIPRGYRKGQLGQFTPEQMQLFQGLFSHTAPGGFLSKLAGGEEGAFDQLEAPALRQFAGLQGNLASRFSGMGSGARRSSGFQQASNQASSDFAQQLQSQRMGLQRQALQDLLGISGELLGQRPYQKFLTEKHVPFWKQLLTGLTSAGGEAAGQIGGAHAMSKFGPKLAGTAATMGV